MSAYLHSSPEIPVTEHSGDKWMTNKIFQALAIQQLGVGTFSPALPTHQKFRQRMSHELQRKTSLDDAERVRQIAAKRLVVADVLSITSEHETNTNACCSYTTGLGFAHGMEAMRNRVGKEYSHATSKAAAAQQQAKTSADLNTQHDVVAKQTAAICAAARDAAAATHALNAIPIATGTNREQLFSEISVVIVHLSGSRDATPAQPEVAAGPPIPPHASQTSQAIQANKLTKSPNRSMTTVQQRQQQEEDECQRDQELLALGSAQSQTNPSTTTAAPAPACLLPRQIPTGPTSRCSKTGYAADSRGQSLEAGSGAAVQQVYQHSHEHFQLPASGTSTLRQSFRTEIEEEMHPQLKAAIIEQALAWEQIHGTCFCSQDQDTKILPQLLAALLETTEEWNRAHNNSCRSWDQEQESHSLTHTPKYVPHCVSGMGVSYPTTHGARLIPSDPADLLQMGDRDGDWCDAHCCPPVAMGRAQGGANTATGGVEDVDLVWHSGSSTGPEAFALLARGMSEGPDGWGSNGDGTTPACPPLEGTNVPGIWLQGFETGSTAGYKPASQLSPQSLPYLPGWGGRMAQPAVGQRQQQQHCQKQHTYVSQLPGYCHSSAWPRDPPEEQPVHQQQQLQQRASPGGAFPDLNSTYHLSYSAPTPAASLQGHAHTPGGHQVTGRQQAVVVPSYNVIPARRSAYTPDPPAVAGTDCVSKYNTLYDSHSGRLSHDYVSRDSSSQSFPATPSQCMPGGVQESAVLSAEGQAWLSPRRATLSALLPRLRQHSTQEPASICLWAPTL